MKKSENKKEVNVANKEIISTTKSKKYNLFADWNDIKGKDGKGRFNRKVDMSKPRKSLIVSIAKTGARTPLLILKTRAFMNMWLLLILDGQNRFAAIKYLGLEFEYKVLQLLDDTQENAIALMKEYNITAERWNSSNYLEGEVALGKYEYVKMFELLKSDFLTFKDIFSIYGVTATEFRSGVMKFKNEKESDSLLKSILFMSNHIPNVANCRRAIFRILKTEKISHKTLSEIIKKGEKEMAKKGEVFSSDERTFEGQVLCLMKLNKITLRIAA